MTDSTVFSLKDFAASTSRRRWLPAYLLALVCSIAAAAAVVLVAVDVQSARLVDADGRSWSIQATFGPFSGLSSRQQGWAVVTSRRGLLDDLGTYQRLLEVHLVVDAVFGVCMVVLLVCAVMRLFQATGSRELALLPVAIVMLADLVENGAAWAVLASYPSTPEVGVLLAADVAGLSTAKWATVGVIVVVIALRLALSRGEVALSGGGGLRRAAKAVMHQRFSFVPVAVMFVLGVLSGSAILEQLPDVQRRWIDDRSGLGHGVAAVTATVVVAVFLYLVGRHRTAYANRHRAGVPGASDGWPQSSVWLVGPVISTVSAVVLLAWGQQKILLGRFVIFSLVLPALIIGGSALALLYWRGRGQWVPDQPRDFTPEERDAVSLAGCVAAGAAVAVGGLSLIRSFVPLVVLPPPADGSAEGT